jgi:hypothetical protein
MDDKKGSQPSVAELTDLAIQNGNLSGETSRILQANDLGRVFDQALGLPTNLFQTSEAVIVTGLIDDSGSIRFVSGNAEAVRTGHNLIIESLKGSKQKDSILISTRYLNGKILMSYRLLDNAIQMDSNNYNPNEGTPLYDSAFDTLQLVLAKTIEYENNGIPVRTITYIATDGHDQHSNRHTTKDVASLARDMFRMEKHIIAGMGISDGETDFRQIFGEMGIPDQWILTPNKDASAIRKAFATVSQSAVRVSQQSGVNLSQIAAGGFATE